MFLRQRCRQAEYFDADRPAAELRDFFSALDRMNRFARYAEPFEAALPPMLGPTGSLLEIGSGNGALSNHLIGWATLQGWRWEATELDLNPAALELSPGKNKVVGSALALPFPDDSFDAVIASQMTHHLTTAEAVMHLREAWRVARCGVVVTDLRRSALFYVCLWLLTLGGYSRAFRHDALLSVRKAWTREEMRGLAHQAGLVDANVRSQYGTRLILTARKRAHR